jgi:hypothetical protein
LHLRVGARPVTSAAVAGTGVESDPTAGGEGEQPCDPGHDPS